LKARVLRRRADNTASERAMARLLLGGGLGGREMKKEVRRKEKVRITGTPR